VRIEGTYSFPARRAEVWAALQDPEILSVTLPGVRRLEVVGPDRYALTALVGVGAVKGTYEGAFSIEDKRELESCVLRGSGRGAPGSARVEARVRLEDSDGGTVLLYEADASVAGAVAGVGQRLISAAARKTTQEFLDAVARALASPPVPAGAAAGAGVPPAAGNGRVFARPQTPASAGAAFGRGVAVGFALALAGVVVGRWSARR
jgi:carbon monoxide dehydrogenase subunit G